MKKVLFLLTSILLSLSLVSCAMGECAKGYKYAKEDIEYHEYQEYKVKFEGGNWVYVEAQEVSNGSIFGLDLGTTRISEAYYYEILFKITDENGKETSKTAYYSYVVGKTNSFETIMYSTYADSVAKGSLKGKTGTL